jgi:hypothetical protein
MGVIVRGRWYMKMSPSKEMLRSKEEGCANVSVNENGYLSRVRMRVKSVRLNVSERCDLEVGNESVTG